MMNFAVIPTAGRACLKQSFEAIDSQVDKVFLIETDATAEYRIEGCGIFRRHCDFLDVGTVNISRWWNHGLRLAEAEARRGGHEQWNVAIINDDAIVPPGWIDAVCARMNQEGAVAGCSGNHNVTQRLPVAVPLDQRMTGYAFVLAGGSGLWANEELHWYFTDDYLDWEARKAGGMSMVRGFPVEHLHPNGLVDEELHRQIARDAQTFVDIYGRRPW